MFFICCCLCHIGSFPSISCPIATTGRKEILMSLLGDFSSILVMYTTQNFGFSFTFTLGDEGHQKKKKGEHRQQYKLSGIYSPLHGIQNKTICFYSYYYIFLFTKQYFCEVAMPAMAKRWQHCII